MIRAIRIRLYPTPDQKKYLAGLFGAVRFCFNKALYLKTHFYKVKGVNLHPIHDLKKLIAIAKKYEEVRLAGGIRLHGITGICSQSEQSL